MLLKDNDRNVRVNVKLQQLSVSIGNKSIRYQDIIKVAGLRHESLQILTYDEEFEVQAPTGKIRDYYKDKLETRSRWARLL